MSDPSAPHPDLPSDTGDPFAETAPADDAVAVVAAAASTPALAVTATGTGLSGRLPTCPGDELRVGDHLGNYTITGVLGRGGMGVVYAAYDPRLDRKVAVKLLRGRHGDGSVSDADSARFLREARAIARLNHPNVITVYGAETAAGRDYVAMEYVDGQSLAEWLDTPRPWRDVVQTFALAGRGLRAAHDAGLIHRDFKPANVLLSRDGRVLVTDFGLARALGHDRDDGSSETPTPGRAPARVDPDPSADASADPRTPDSLGSSAFFTRTGAIMGTPAYMAPEQHRGEAVLEASDQYSFCVSLHEALYRRRPFAETTLDELITAKSRGRLADPPGETTHGAVPRRLRRLVLRGLSPVPDDRHPSMHDLLLALGRASRSPWRTIAAVMIAAGVVAMVVAVVAATLTRSPGPAAALPSLCATGSAEDGWHRDARARLAEILASSNAPYAGRVRETATARLESNEAAWRQARTALCGEPGDAGLTARAACLGDYRARVDRLLGAMARSARPHGDDDDGGGDSDGDSDGGSDDDIAIAIDGAAPALEALPDPGLCVTASAAPGPAPALPDRGTQGAVDDLRAELAAGELRLHAQRYADAQDLLAPLIERARDLDHPPVLAEVLLTAGQADLARASVGPARDKLAEAALLGEESGHAELHARALVALTALEIAFAGDQSSSPQLLRRATAAVERFARAPALQAGLDSSRAVLASKTRRHDEALALFESARAAHVSAGKAIDAADSLTAVVAVHYRRGDYQTALATAERAHEEIVALLGAEHPRSLLTLEASLDPLLALHRWDEARERAVRVAPFWRGELGRQLLGDHADFLEKSSGPARLRPVTGRVVDAERQPVAGVEVVIGRALLSDGKYLMSATGGRQVDQMRIQRARSGSDGRFAFTGIPALPMTLAAESDDGRSWPVNVPAEDAGEPYELALRPFGRIRGQLVSPEGVETTSEQFMVGVEAQIAVKDPVQPGPKGARNAISSIIYSTVIDDRFDIERLAAGRYKVSLIRVVQNRVQARDKAHITVKPGQTASLELTVDNRGNTLRARIHGKYGVTIPAAQLALLPGDVSPSTVGELNDLMVTGKVDGFLFGYETSSSSPGTSRTTGRPPGLIIEAAQVLPGHYSACVIPLADDLEDVEFLRQYFEHAEALAIYCSPLDVSEEPAIQTHELEVPPMKPFPVAGAE